MVTRQIILASASPRRRELLDQIGVSYRVQVADIDETPLSNELAKEYVTRIAAAKSQQVWQQSAVLTVVLAADTSVVLDGHIMGKPINKADSLRMLRLLSGTTHKVYSAVSLRIKDETKDGVEYEAGEHWQALSITKVRFRKLQESEIEAYWQTGEPLDKAGSYAIQGRAGQFIEHISGSFSGVMGLPLFETTELLAKAGIVIL